MAGAGAHAAHAAHTTTSTGTTTTTTPGVRGDTDLALVNGRIHTMDANDTVVSHVLIRNGRFIAVGDGPMRAQGRPFDVVNLRGRTAIPGIIDNHNHIVLMGNRPGHHTPLENAYSVADVQETYALRAKDLPAGAWITTIGGFHRNHLVPPDQPPRLPTRAELDEAVPDHPVYLSESFSGPSATNSAGRAFFAGLGIPVGDDGSIVAGNPTGRATLALRQTLLTPDERKRGTVDAIAYGLSLGVTTHLDQGAFQATNTPSDGAAHEDNFTMHLPFLSLLEERRLDARLRINFLHMESDQGTPELAARLRNAFPFFGGDLARTGGIGEFIAQGTGPASPFLAAARKVAAAGWRAEVHSLSATDFQQEIQAFEAVNAETPITDLRWVVAHVPFITREYVDRLDALGGGLSLTGWRYLAGSPAQNGPPFRMIADSGIHAGMSSDGMQIAPMNPWLHMYYATTGRNARGVLINDGQQLTRPEVLRLYTRDNGWFLREEDELGSIEVGKHADLAVLDRDYFTVPDEELKQLRSLFTVVGGRVVHDPGRWAR
ncbi:amidohydrolase [Jiangella aurantiaca]|nr:amidohydrolase family protein [Jiangella aurantiaca]